MTETPRIVNFEWSPRHIKSEHERLPGNLWCVRDAFCTLLRWEQGSDEWNAFIQAPAPEDMEWLIEHIGLLPFYRASATDVEIPEPMRDHPGVTFHNLHRLRIAHCLYQLHVRHLVDLPTEYTRFDANPELFCVAVDPRQPPH